jgi:uncharacterized protein YjeT (DUF2065 family)
MELILHFIGFVWVALGAVQILYTEKTREVVRQITRDSGYKVASAPPLLVGVLLIFSSFWSQVVAFVLVLGVLVFLYGAFVLLAPQETMDRFFKAMVFEASDELFRLRGIFFLILGTALLSAA